ncbi:MAG: hypothetical protein ACREDQ_02895 [Limisphaerales bacterium]
MNARPQPGLLPQEKEQQLRISDFGNGCPANPVARAFKAAANDSPSPWGEGRDEGGQKSSFTGQPVRGGAGGRGSSGTGGIAGAAKRNVNVGDSTCPRQKPHLPWKATFPSGNIHIPNGLLNHPSLETRKRCFFNKSKKRTD